jgi:large subunit ribosomal protein L5
MTTRFAEKYNKEIKGAMKDKFGYKNVNQIPKIEKIIINCVTRDCVQNGKMVEGIVDDLTKISGQKAVIARAKNSIASFKLKRRSSSWCIL